MSQPAVKVASVPTAAAPIPHGTNRKDNQHLAEKLAVRRHFLDKYPSPDGTFRVIDCCAGERQEIWTKLRTEYSVQYLGLDKKAVGGGILKVDAARWLTQTEWQADVVDIDTYGEPWAIFESALENFAGRDLTMFLTCGNVPINSAIGRMSAVVKRRLDLPEGWDIWNPRVLAPLATRAMLAYALTCGFGVVEAARVTFATGPESGMRRDANLLYLYMGMRLRWLT